MRHELPLIGLTLDAEPAGGYSSYPWYVMRQNYAAAIAGARGLPIGLPHHAELAGAYLDGIAGLVVTGGGFDVDPRLYGAGARHASLRLKEGRTASEVALLRGALARGMPVLGICGGEQLLAVVLGGRLTQHIPDEVPGAPAHQRTDAHHEAAHEIALAPGALLARILGAERMAVNSSHRQAVAEPGEALVNARAPDGVIEGIEDPRRNFCLGVPWHPEFFVDPGDRRIFDALIAACRR